MINLRCLIVVCENHCVASLFEIIDSHHIGGMYGPFDGWNYGLDPCVQRRGLSEIRCQFRIRYHRLPTLPGLVIGGLHQVRATAETSIRRTHDGTKETLFVNDEAGQLIDLYDDTGRTILEHV